MNKNELVPGRVYRVDNMTMRYMYTMTFADSSKCMIFWPVFGCERFAKFTIEEEEINSLMKVGAFPLFEKETFVFRFKEIKTFELYTSLN